MVPYLDRSNITVVTSNILVVNELIRMGISCIILGGDIILELESVVGSITEKMLDNMYFDKAFIGTNGFSERGGVSTCDAREARKKEMAKDNAREVYVLADSSKANRRAFLPCLLDRRMHLYHRRGLRYPRGARQLYPCVNPGVPSDRPPQAPEGLGGIFMPCILNRPDARRGGTPSRPRPSPRRDAGSAADMAGHHLPAQKAEGRGA